MFVKYGTGGKNYYKEIRDAWNNKVSLSIIELGFLSNYGDTQMLVNNVERISSLIASVYANECGKVLDSNVQAIKENDNGELYRVQVGAFRKKQYAQALVDDLKSKGYNVIIK